MQVWFYLELCRARHDSIVFLWVTAQLYQTGTADCPTVAPANWDQTRKERNSNCAVLRCTAKFSSLYRTATCHKALCTSLGAPSLTHPGHTTNTGENWRHQRFSIFLTLLYRAVTSLYWTTVSSSHRSLQRLASFYLLSLIFQLILPPPCILADTEDDLKTNTRHVLNILREIAFFSLFTLYFIPTWPSVANYRCSNLKSFR